MANIDLANLMNTKLDKAGEEHLTSSNNLLLQVGNALKSLPADKVANAVKISPILGRYDFTIKSQTFLDVAIAKGKIVKVTIKPSVNGYFSVALGNNDTYTYGGTTTLINAGETHEFVYSNLPNDFTQVRINNNNSVEAEVKYEAEYGAKEAILESSKNANGITVVSEGLEQQKLFSTGSGSIEFSSSSSVDFFVPAGESVSVSVTNNGNGAGYFGAGFQDKSNTTITGFGGQLIAAGETYTFTPSVALKRDCYYLKLTNINGIKALASVSVGENLLLKDRKAVNELKSFSKSFYDSKANVNVINVNADESADFADIQSAINSVTDASPTNLYEIRVHSDFRFTDLTDLYKLSSFGKNTEVNPTSHVAAIIGREFISVVGVGARKVIEVESPTTISGTSLQYVQVAYPIGNFKMKNLHLKIKGGRYAIHQESGGNDGHLDNNATTVYEDLIIEHCGNSGYNSGWSSCYAMATGTAGGQHIIYKDCTFISREIQNPFYFHGNKGENTEERKITFENCHTVVKDGSVLTTWDSSKYYPYFGELGDRNKTTITIKNCDFSAFMLNNPVQRGSETEMSEAFKDCSSFAPVLKGYGNRPFLVASIQLNCLCFTSANNGEEVDVVGGSAYDDIWGGTCNKFIGSNAKGIAYGKMFIADASSLWLPKNYTFELAYKLGNCASSPKTLVVSIGGVEKTITFNKNYMTANGSAYTSKTTPAVSMSTIIADINAALEGSATVTKYSPAIFQSFDDCKETTKNTSGISWVCGTLLVRDFIGATQKWRKANSGEIAEGVALNRIDDGNYGEIFLIEKILLSTGLVFGISTANATKGKMYKVSSSNSLEVTTNKSEATFIVFSDGFFEKA